MAEPLINDGNLGAWLIKCNPDTWDFPGWYEDGNRLVDDWSLKDGYRSRLMKPGDRILFWLSGTPAARGLRGHGYVTSYSYDTIPDGDYGHWLDHRAADAVTTGIDVDIPVWEVTVTDADLRAAGIDDLEVQRMPQGSNPSWLTKDQLAKIEPLLPDWPQEPDDEEIIVVGPHGAGCGDAERNKVVELVAMEASMNLYREDGWTLKDVSDQKLGWDIQGTKPSGETIKIEVKGCSGDRQVVLLTRGEVEAAKIHEDWVLAVVTRALSAPELEEFSRDTAIATARPYVYKADLTAPQELV